MPIPVPPGLHNCPAHQDRHPSLNVTRTPEGKTLLHCHVGCDPEAILRAWGCTWLDVFPDDGRDRPYRLHLPPVDQAMAALTRRIDRRQAPEDERIAAEAIAQRRATARRARALITELAPWLGEDNDRLWQLAEQAAALDQQADNWEAAWDHAQYA